MIYNIIILVLILLILITFYEISLKTESFYNASKPDQRPFEMEDHTYDGDLVQAEKILYTMIKGVKNNVLKSHLSELLNLLQFI